MVLNPLAIMVTKYNLHINHKTLKFCFYTEQKKKCYIHFPKTIPLNFSTYLLPCRNSGNISFPSSIAATTNALGSENANCARARIFVLIFHMNNMQFNPQLKEITDQTLCDFKITFLAYFHFVLILALYRHWCSPMVSH